MEAEPSVMRRCPRTWTVCALRCRTGLLHATSTALAPTISLAATEMCLAAEHNDPTRVLYLKPQKTVMNAHTLPPGSLLLAQLLLWHGGGDDCSWLVPGVRNCYKRTCWQTIVGLVLFMLTHAHIARFDSSLSGKLSPNWSEKGQGYPRRRRRHRHRLARRDEGALATAVAPALVATALAPSMSPPLPPPLLPSLVTPRAARAATRTRHWAGALALKLRLRSCVLQLGARDSAFAHCASRAPLYTASTTVIAIAISIPTAHGPSLTTVSHCGTRRWAVPLWHQLHCTSQLQLYPRPLAESSSRGRARSRRRAAASIIIFIR